MAEFIKHHVLEWLRLDKNKNTRNEIQTLWDNKNLRELHKRLSSRIEFGTAGLRGRMEAGWSRMNDLIIIQASQGLCAYVLAHVKNAAERGIVIGHDHRHNSEYWAHLTASVFVANRVKVYLLRGLVHTPLVPFSVKKLNAACGVMITASHNPKYDNGYKVYWENAVQIISPHDKGISDSILANLEPKSWGFETSSPFDVCIDLTKTLIEAYFTELASFNLSKSLNVKSSIIFVNSSMHGVSHPFVSQAFTNFGFKPFIPVKEQQEPDPEFPTVQFPNPEEKGALDLAIRTADHHGAIYVLAQDPDSDRFSASEKGPDGKWITFTGDQLGILFASRVLETYKASGKPIDKLAMVASTVSSKMIQAMAYIEGFVFAECLTGFKFIGNRALDLVKAGYEVPFGYEEAIGYMFGSEIRDKDGVSATVTFAELVIVLRQRGQTVQTFLRELYDRYGYFQTSNGYFTCTDPPIIDRIFARIRNFRGEASETSSNYPTSIGGLFITRVIDFTTGFDSGNPPTYKPVLPLSSGHMIQFHAGTAKDGTKIVLTTRTSGTEPKIKYYLEGSGKDAEMVRTTLPAVVEELADVWFEAERNNLCRL